MLLLLFLLVGDGMWGVNVLLVELIRRSVLCPDLQSFL